MKKAREESSKRRSGVSMIEQKADCSTGKSWNGSLKQFLHTTALQCAVL